MELTSKQLEAIFNVTPMTIYNWREGKDKKKLSSLPYYTIKAGKRHRITFKWSEVKDWAKQNSVKVVRPPKVKKV